MLLLSDRPWIERRLSMALIDLTGGTFGRLAVIERGESVPSGSARWLCRCECGSMVTVSGSSLRRGATRSCGCLAREIQYRLARQKDFRRRAKAGRPSA
jgi:hypothetical protein